MIQNQETWIPVTALMGTGMDPGLSFLIWEVMGNMGHFLSSLPFCNCDFEVLSPIPDSVGMFWLQVTDSLDLRV